MSSGTRIIPGSSSIHFDRVARKRIYESIDAAKTNDVRLIREAYKSLKSVSYTHLDVYKRQT